MSQEPQMVSKSKTTKDKLEQPHSSDRQHAQPIFSVILPTYNAENTIYETLNSVLNQTIQNIEILIYDDASIDSTKTKICNIKDSRIKIIYSETNEGAGIARDTLLKMSTGRYIAFIDSDDTWHPSKLKLQLEAMTKNAANVCTTNYLIQKEAHINLKSVQVPNNITFQKMHQRNWIPMSTAVVESSLLKARCMPELRLRQDYAYWMQLFVINSTIKHTNVNQELCTYRRRKARLSRNPFINIKYNYLVFRETLGYSQRQTLYYLSLNIIFKMLRNG